MNFGFSFTTSSSIIKICTNYNQIKFLASIKKSLWHFVSPNFFMINYKLREFFQSERHFDFSKTNSKVVQHSHTLQHQNPQKSYSTNVSTSTNISDNDIKARSGLSTASDEMSNDKRRYSNHMYWLNDIHCGAFLLLNFYGLFTWSNIVIVNLLTWNRLLINRFLYCDLSCICGW